MSEYKERSKTHSKKCVNWLVSEDMMTKDWWGEEIDEDYYGEDDEDDFETQLANCGMTREGFCLLAGTEYCDWDCQIDWNSTDLEDAHSHTDTIEVDAYEWQEGQQAVFILEQLGIKYELWRHAETLGDIDNIRNQLRGGA